MRQCRENSQRLAPLCFLNVTVIQNYGGAKLVRQVPGLLARIYDLEIPAGALGGRTKSGAVALSGHVPAEHGD